ncbi:MAG: hypothetical protein AAGN82_29130 [Myxococcota bacterium]
MSALLTSGPNASMLAPIAATVALIGGCSCGSSGGDASSTMSSGSGGTGGSGSGTTTPASGVTVTATSSGSGGGGVAAGWSEFGEEVTPCALHRPDDPRAAPQMELVGCALAGWSGCQKWEPSWERSGYSAVLGTVFDTSQTPTRLGVLLFPNDENVAAVYDLPGGPPRVAVRSTARCFLSRAIPAGVGESWLVVGDVETGGEWGHFALTDDYTLDPVEFTGVDLSVSSADGNANFFGGTPSGSGAAYVWDRATATERSVKPGIGSAVFGFDYLDDGVLFTVMEPDQSTRMVFQKQGGALISSVVATPAGRSVVQASVVGGTTLVWAEVDDAATDGEPGFIFTAPWSSEGPFPVSGTQVAAVDPTTLFVASPAHVVMFDLDQGILNVVRLSDGTVTPKPSPATGGFFSGMKFVGQDGLGGEALWVNTYDALYRLSLD